MNLNVGAGDFRAGPSHHWTNVDVNPGREPDVVADLRSLPFEDGEFDRVYAGHVLEHLPAEDVADALRELRRVSTGEIMLVGPDVRRGAEMLRRGEIDPEQFAAIGAEGGCEAEVPGDGDHHRWDCSDEALQAFVHEAGLRSEWLRIVDVPRDWPVTSRIGWQCAARIPAVTPS